MTRSVAIALTTGLALGALLGALWPLSAHPEPPTARREAPAEPRRVRCPELPVDLDAAIDASWARLELADAALRSTQATIEDLIGTRPGFEGLVDRLGPDHIEDYVQDLLEGGPGTLEWIDCSEAPCVAVLSIPDSDLATLRAAADPLREGLADGYPWEAFGVQGGWWMTVPLGPPTHDDTRHHRVDLREELIINELLHARMSQ